MRRALELARTKAPYASPNPRVGAVVVRRGRVVGEGATHPFGGPHAEVVALRQAGKRAKGATLYVTLEPCAHRGKTPPCTEAILRAGIRRVVAATGDPFPLVAGKGFARLRREGVKVEKGLLAREAREVNPAFFFSVEKRRPWVLLKAGVSLDGKIAGTTGRSRWITGDGSRRRVHELRAKSDAILVGIGTALKDDPSLTVRLPGWHRKDGFPLRVVLDSFLRLPLRARLLKGPTQTLVFTSFSASLARQRALESRGALVFRVPSSGKLLSLRAILRVLRAFPVRSLLVEGGGEVHASFIREGLADSLALFLSPKMIGGRAPSWIGGTGLENPNLAPYLKDMTVEKMGADLLVQGHF